MKITLDGYADQHYIRAYRAGEIVINDDVYRSSLIVSAKNLLSEWEPRTIGQLTAGHLEPVLSLQPEVVLLGTGNKLVFPPPAILEQLRRHRIGIEVMDTGAACRTYNVLVSEGRAVVAALIIGPTTETGP